MSESLIPTNIERTKRQLNNVEVQARLGNVASKLLLLANNLYVPNMLEDGRIDVKDGGIPIVSLNAGEDLQLSGDALGFSEEQRKAMWSKGIGLGEQDRMENTLTDRVFTVPDFMHGAVVSRRGTYSTKAGEVTVSGRPVVVLNGSKPAILAANTTLAHELVHVSQDQNKPFKRKSGYPMVQREAEAYSIEGHVQAGLQKDKPRATKANRVMRAYEDFRKSGRTLKEEAEQLDFERQLRKEGIGILGKNVQLPGEAHSH
ncbi:MAG TPA: hypothetical protein GXZ59_00095 [Clostridiaceae bacterium]|nr:hypothetical protein [Clostridiaceae bacterium]